jgi:hypothetical protein
MHSARIVDTFLRASLTASLAGGAAFFGGDFRGCGTFSASGCSNGAAALIARPLDLARSASALVGIFTSFSGFLAIVLAGGAALPLPLAAGLATGAGGGGGAAFGGDFFGGDFFGGGAAFFVCEAVCEAFLAGIRSFASGRSVCVAGCGGWAIAVSKRSRYDETKLQQVSCYCKSPVELMLASAPRAFVRTKARIVPRAHREGAVPLLHAQQTIRLRPAQRGAWPDDPATLAPFGIPTHPRAVLRRVSFVNTAEHLASLRHHVVDDHSRGGGGGSLEHAEVPVGANEAVVTIHQHHVA